MISSSPPGTLRVGSVSSTRSNSQSPSERLATALNALPTWSEPVGLGANRTRFISTRNLAPETHGHPAIVLILATEQRGEGRRPLHHRPAALGEPCRRLVRAERPELD